MTQDLVFMQLTDKVQINKADLLGSGSTGNVYGGFYRNSPYEKPQIAAIKTIDLQTIDTPVMSYLLQCEIEAMKFLSKTKNPYIVMLYDVIFIGRYVYIVMQRLYGGTLREYMDKSHGALQKGTILEIFAKIVQGYSSLADNCIIHRDLKPQNIMFRDKNYLEPCIIDFGYCVSPQVKKIPKMYYNVGSPKYMSPEAYYQSKYSQKSDIWALGVVLYEMFTGRTFDQGISVEEALGRLGKKGVPYPPNFDGHLTVFINQLLTYNLTYRITFLQLRENVKNHFSSHNQQIKIQKIYFQNPQQSFQELQSKIKRIKTQENSFDSVYENIVYKAGLFHQDNRKNKTVFMSSNQILITKRTNPSPIQKTPFMTSNQNNIKQKHMFIKKNFIPNKDIQEIPSLQISSPTFYMQNSNKIQGNIELKFNQNNRLKSPQTNRTNFTSNHKTILSNFGNRQVISPKTPKNIHFQFSSKVQNNKLPAAFQTILTPKKSKQNPSSQNHFLKFSNGVSKQQVQMRKIMKIN